MDKTWRSWTQYWGRIMVRKEKEIIKDASNQFDIQDFANQVKAINLQKGPPVPKLANKNDERREDCRSKALEYSKKVPKPIVKTYEK